MSKDSDYLVATVAERLAAANGDLRTNDAVLQKQYQEEAKLFISKIEEQGVVLIRGDVTFRKELDTWAGKNMVDKGDISGILQSAVFAFLVEQNKVK